MRKLILMLIIYFIYLSANAKNINPFLLYKDLQTYSGSYKTIEGNKAVCPEGEFGANSGTFVVGSDLRITNINMPKTTELLDRISACKLQRKSTYDGKQLKYLLIESCPKALDLIKEYIFEFSKTDKIQTIKIQFFNNDKIQKKKASQLIFSCLYTRELKKNN